MNQVQPSVRSPLLFWQLPLLYINDVHDVYIVIGHSFRDLSITNTQMHHSSRIEIKIKLGKQKMRVSKNFMPTNLIGA
jgi:hypothetical protein